MTDSPNIVITGVGLVTALGATAAETWRNILAGRTGFGPMPALESPLPAGKDGAQAVDLPDDFAADVPREARYLRRAILDALADADVDDAHPSPPHRRAVMLGTTLHGMRAAGRYLRTNDATPLRDFLAGATLRHALEKVPVTFTGPAVTTCSACSSSLGSIALAVSMLRAGEVDLVVTGGYDTVSEYAYAGFSALRLISPGFLRPFCTGRQGMKLAEGYGIVVLERAADAAARSAKVVATVRGFGESADAHHLTQPHPQGAGAAAAMRSALADANMSAGDVGMIMAHATGTPDNDNGEAAAIATVFGQARPLIAALKSRLGHTLGGAGAVELILSAFALRDQVVPSAANVDPGDVEFANLNVASGDFQRAKLHATLNTSLGFGGANTCVVLTREEMQKSECRVQNENETSFNNRQSTTNNRQDVFITGVGVLFPGIVGNAAFLQRLRTPDRVLLKDTGSIPEADYVHLLNARRVRRMSDYVKLSLAATTLALRDAGLDAANLGDFAASCPVLLGSAHGSANYSAAYYSQIVKEGIDAANPMLFAEGVPNAAAAHLSLMLGLKGACQTVIGVRTAGLDALRLAATRIASGEWSHAIVGAAEEYDEHVNRGYAACGLYAGHYQSAADAELYKSTAGFVTGAGAVTFILESAASIAARNGSSKGQVLAAASRRGPIETLEETVGNLLKDDIRQPKTVVIGSFSNTRFDHAELYGHLRANPGLSTTLYGHIAETFSVGPLAGIAGAILAGHPERMNDANARAYYEEERRCAVTCIDSSGLASAVAFAVTNAADS